MEREDRQFRTTQGRDCPCCFGFGVTFSGKPTNMSEAVHLEESCAACDGEGVVTHTKAAEITGHMVTSGIDSTSVWMGYRCWS